MSSDLGADALRPEGRGQGMLNKYRVLKRHRTCNRCRAMYRGSCGHSDTCELGYDLEMRRGMFGSWGYPGEPCPKPTTYKELLDSPRKWELPQWTVKKDGTNKETDSGKKD